MLALRRRSQQLLTRHITASQPQYASVFRQKVPLSLIRPVEPLNTIHRRSYARFSSGRGGNNGRPGKDPKDPKDGKRPSLEEFQELFQAEYDFPVDLQNFSELPLPAQTFIRLMATPKTGHAALNPLFDIGAKFWEQLSEEEREGLLTLMRRNEMEDLVLTLYNQTDGDFSAITTAILAEATFKTFQTFRAQSNESIEQLIAKNPRVDTILKKTQEQATIPGFNWFNFGGGKGRGIQFGFNTGGGKGGKGGKEFRFDGGTIFVSLFLTYILWKATMPGEPAQEITWQEFRSAFLDKGLVEKLTVINRDLVRVQLNRAAAQQQYAGREGAANSGIYNYYFSIGSVDAFERKLEQAQDDLDIPPSERIPVSYTNEVSWLSTAASVLPTLLLIGSIFWLSRKAGTPGGGIGKSRAKLFNAETDIKTKFKDVAGMDEAKQEIMEFVSFLKTPGIYQKLGAKIPRGAILAGPPGTGKTLLAKATAGEAGVPFFSVSGSEFVEMFVGVGPSRVRDLFAKARKNTPCIIFIDEIDAIGRSRAKGNFGGGNDERESTLNQLLTEMDGFNTSDQIVVLAGTNRADVLDKALMRPGRFDRHIYVDRPTMGGRKQIFLVHLKNIVTKVDMEYLSGRLAALTPGFAGADIANCVNEAAVIAARNKAESVELTHFEQAIERVIAGLEKKSLVLSPDEKKIVAYHEAGHAICGWFLKHADPLLKVSIIPRGQGALGYAQYLPEGDRYLMSRSQFEDRMIMTLGGRVSEEIHFESVTSGGSDDFSKVTQMANSMVTRYGMSKELGTVQYVVDEQALNKPFSEETARLIDVEVKKIVDNAHEACRKLLTEKKVEVGLVAEELLKKEVIGREDMIRLLGRRKWGDNKEFEKFFDARDGQTITPPPFPQETDNTDTPKTDSTPTV